MQGTDDGARDGIARENACDEDECGHSSMLLQKANEMRFTSDDDVQGTDSDVICNDNKLKHAVLLISACKACVYGSTKYRRAAW